MMLIALTFYRGKWNKYEATASGSYSRVSYSFDNA